MSTIKSSDEHLTLNADGSSKDIKFQANGVEKGSLSSAGVMTATSFAGSGASLTALNATNLASGTVPTARLGSGTASSSTFLRGDGAWQSAGGDNTPNFLAYSNATQTLSDNVATKIQFNSESYDSDTAYDHSSNYRFTVPSGEAGKYFIYAQAYTSQQANALYFVQFFIYKNGSALKIDSTNMGSIRADGFTFKILSVEDLAVDDYIEIYITMNSDPSNNGYVYANHTYFNMFKLL